MHWLKLESQPKQQWNPKVQSRLGSLWSLRTVADPGNLTASVSTNGRCDAGSSGCAGVGQANSLSIVSAEGGERDEIRVGVNRNLLSHEALPASQLAWCDAELLIKDDCIARVAIHS